MKILLKIGCHISKDDIRKQFRMVSKEQPEQNWILAKVIENTKWNVISIIEIKEI